MADLYDRHSGTQGKVQVDGGCPTDGLSSKSTKAHAMASPLAETEAFSLRELARAKHHE